MFPKLTTLNSAALSHGCPRFLEKLASGNRCSADGNRCTAHGNRHRAYSNRCMHRLPSGGAGFRTTPWCSGLHHLGYPVAPMVKAGSVGTLAPETVAAAATLPRPFKLARWSRWARSASSGRWAWNGPGPAPGPPHSDLRSLTDEGRAAVRVSHEVTEHWASKRSRIPLYPSATHATPPIDVARRF